MREPELWLAGDEGDLLPDEAGEDVESEEDDELLEGVDADEEEELDEGEFVGNDGDGMEELVGELVGNDGMEDCCVGMV